jgi:hypothetical protein
MFSNVGDLCGTFCEQNNELYLYHWIRDTNVSKKVVLTNCMIKKNKNPRDRSCTNVIPAYEDYNIMFNLCDILHRYLHDRSWSLPTEHNFAFYSILENVFSLYMYMNSTYCT